MLSIHASRPALRTLVGVRWPDGYEGPLPEECNLIIHDGRITSIAPVSTQGYPLGMAFVEPALAAPGTRVEVRLDDGTTTPAEVAELRSTTPPASGSGYDRHPHQPAPCIGRRRPGAGAGTAQPS